MTGRIARADSEVAKQFGITVATLRRWVRQAEIEAGERQGVSGRWPRSPSCGRKNAELEHTVEILKAAASFFAREYDPRPPPSAGSSPNTENGSESYRSVER